MRKRSPQNSIHSTNGEVVRDCESSIVQFIHNVKLNHLSNECQETSIGKKGAIVVVEVTVEVLVTMEDPERDVIQIAVRMTIGNTEEVEVKNDINEVNLLVEVGAGVEEEVLSRANLQVMSNTLGRRKRV
jgi:hypothetical protein